MSKEFALGSATENNHIVLLRKRRQRTECPRTRSGCDEPILILAHEFALIRSTVETENWEYRAQRGSISSRREEIGPRREKGRGEKRRKEKRGEPQITTTMSTMSTGKPTRNNKINTGSNKLEDLQFPGVIFIEKVCHNTMVRFVSPIFSLGVSSLFLSVISQDARRQKDTWSL